MMKKLLSVLLVMAMLLSVLPMGAFADGGKAVVFADGDASVDGGDTGDAGTGDDTPAVEAVSVTINADEDNRGASASASADGLVLMAIYDRGGSRMIAYRVGTSVSVDEDYISADMEYEGECVARAFLLEPDTLIPMCEYAQVSLGELKNNTTDETTEPTKTEGSNTVTAELKAGALYVGGFGKLDADIVWPENLDMSGVKKIVIDPNADFDSVDASAFQSFPNLTTLDIGGVKEIEEDAFAANSKLTQVTIRLGKLERIGDGAFAVEALAVNKTTVIFDGTKADWDNLGAPIGAFLSGTHIRLKDASIVIGNASEENAEQETEETVVEEPTAETPAAAEEDTQLDAEEDVQKNTEDETVQEQLTLEDAAKAGYYVAPEGAAMTEDAALEEMAAFTGKTTGKQAKTTSTFTGLMPGQPYQLVVSKATYAPTTDNPSLEEMVREDAIVYTNQATAGTSGSLSFTYEVTTREDILVQLYGLANKRTVTLRAADGSVLEPSDMVDEDGNPIVNLTLKLSEADKDYTLKADVEPVQWQDLVEWSSSKPSVVTVEDGKLTPVNAGTAYIKATVKNGVYAFSATCRVLVIDDASQELTDVALQTTSATTELYRTEGTTIKLFPEIGDKVLTQIATYDAEEDEDTDTGDEALGHLIQEAKFASKDKNGDIVLNDTMNKLFTLEVVDDWTLRLIPTDYAVENPSEVKSKYVSQIVLTVKDDSKEDTDSREILTAKSLTLNIKKTLPKLTASALTINGFYDEKAYQMDIKGATVTGVYTEEAHAGSWPAWLDLDEGSEGQFYVNNDVTTKSATAKVYLSVETKEWAIPATVQATVKLMYKAPSVKLSSTGVTLSTVKSTGVKLKLISQDRSLSLKGLGVEDVVLRDDEDRILISGYDEETGEFTVWPTDEITLGSFKTSLTVTIKDTHRTISLPLTVTAKKAEMKLSKTSLSMNTRYADTAVLKMSMSLKDAQLLDIVGTPEIQRLVGKNYVTEVDGVSVQNELGAEIDEEKGTLTITTGSATVPSATYRVIIKPYGQKAITVSVKTLAKKTLASMTLKATGTLDLTYPDKGIKLTQTFRNIIFDKDVVYKVRKNNDPEKSFETFFEDKKDNGCYTLKDGVDEEGKALVKAGDKLTITAYAYTGENQAETACSASVNLTVKRTPVNMRLSKATLTMNKAADQTLRVSYSYSPSGSNVKKNDTPDIQYSEEGVVTAVADKDSQTLEITLGEKAKEGKTYKIYVRATPADKAATLNVQVASLRNSTVKITASTSGTIDPIRDTSKVTLRYSASNYNFADAVAKDGDVLEPEIKIYASEDGKTYDEDHEVTDLFKIVRDTKRTGQYTITKLPEASLNTTLRYNVLVGLKKAEMGNLTEGQVTVAKPTMKVAPGKCSVKTDRTVTIYKGDPTANTYRFKITGTDKNLNNVEKVTVADKTMASIYEIVHLGEGYFELRVYNTAGFATKAKSGSLKLNVFVRGMDIRTNSKGEEIPNGTVTLKLTVK